MFGPGGSVGSLYFEIFVSSLLASLNAFANDGSE